MIYNVCLWNAQLYLTDENNREVMDKHGEIQLYEFNKQVTNVDQLVDWVQPDMLVKIDYRPPMAERGRLLWRRGRK